MLSIVMLALVTAVVAGVRGTWSPCGASVLSTITPFTEAARGKRWGVAATFYLLGGIVGGTVMGLLTALVAPLASGLATGVALGAAAALALVAAVLDLVSGGRALPPHSRQLNEDDLVTWRSWVYGSWWGLQVGTGVATICMTAGVWLTFALAILTGSATWAVLIGAVFGLTRGLAVVPAWWLRDGATLRRFHAAKARLDEPTRRATLAWLAAAAAVAGGLAAGGTAPVVAAAAVVAATVALVASRPRPASQPETRPEGRPHPA